MVSKNIRPVPAGTENTAEPDKLISIVPQKLTNRQRSELVRKTFPDKYQGFGETEASKGRHTERTGLEYTDEIKALILASESPRIERRSLPVKYTWRSTEALLARLQAAKMAYGPNCTFQEFITQAVLNECERIESKREVLKYV
ncbi:MAG: hypothetical protein J6S92_11900 [Oscillospiraceae bacterium]|nr:hypothetical protein [Oscillospiraceae bacterium]